MRCARVHAHDALRSRTTVEGGPGGLGRLAGRVAALESIEAGEIMDVQQVKEFEVLERRDLERACVGRAARLGSPLMRERTQFGGHAR